MKLFRLAWLDLTRHRSMTVLALLALGMTIGAAGLLFRLGRLAQGRFRTMVPAGEALVGAKSGPVEMLLGCMNLEGPYPGFIPIRLYGTLMNQGKVGFADAEVNTRLHRCIVPMVYCGRLHGYRMLGTNESFLNQPEPGPKVVLAQGEWAHREANVVLGAEVARRERLGIGDEVEVAAWTAEVPEDAVDPAHGKEPSYRLKVTGILAPMGNAWDRALFTNLGESKTILAAGLAKDKTIWGADVLHYLIVYLVPDGLPPLRSLIDERTVAQVVSVPEARASLERLTGTGRMMGSMVMMVVLVLGGLSITGLMIGRSEAKLKQLAILTAMGFRAKELLALVLWEGALLGSGALASGGILDATLFPMLRGAFANSLPSPWDAPSHPWQSWPVWLAALAAILFACCIPLWRFQRAHPREYLQQLS